MNRRETPLRDNEAAAQWLRQHHGGPRYLAARMIDIGHKLIEASTFIAHGKWLPWLRAHREAASSFDTINDALCRTADAARCWEVNPSIYNDRRLTQLVERAQDAFAQAYPATDTTLRLLQQMTPDGLQLALIRCEDSGSPLIAISIDADRWRQAARLDAPPLLLLGASPATLRAPLATPGPEKASYRPPRRSGPSRCSPGSASEPAATAWPPQSVASQVPGLNSRAAWAWGRNSNRLNC